MTPSKSTRPRLRSDVVIAPIANGEVLVASADEQRALVLNESAAVALELCNGTVSLDEIASLFSDCFEIPHERALSDMRALMTQLAKEELLDLEEG